MGGKPQKLELRWFNKDKALIPTSANRYDYTWVDPKDPRYCETHTLVYGARRSLLRRRRNWTAGRTPSEPTSNRPRTTSSSSVSPATS